MERLDLTGQRFGKIVALKVVRIHLPRQLAIWRFRCQCGRTFETQPYNVVSGHTKSCGCWQKEHPARMTHGETRHGKTTPEHGIWKAMHARCRNPHVKGFENYGGRGIRVCQRWRKFANFLADMGRRPGKHLSLDRMNNDGNYTPKNCRWATRKQQIANRRKCIREQKKHDWRASSLHAEIRCSDDLTAAP